MKKQKKIALLLCFALALSGFGSLSVSMAQDGKLPLNLPGLTTVQPDGQIKQTTPPAEKRVKDLDKSKEQGEKGTLHQGKRASYKPGDPFADDLYNISEADVEELMAQGHSVDDIFTADDLGNHLLEDPKKILDRKKQTRQSWDDIEKDIKKEKVATHLPKFKEKHPQAAALLQAEKFTPEEQFELLALFDQQSGSTMKEIIAQYKQRGQQALQELSKQKKSHGTVSQSKLERLGLTPADVEGLDDAALDKLEKLSKQTNKPLKELVQGLKAELEKGGNRQ